jgi:RimJ/RimL family protein N-acetyltransferase
VTPGEALVTERLLLDRLTRDDLPALHAIQSDPAVWRHHPPGVHESLDDTVELLDAVDRAWRNVELGLRAVRPRGGVELLGTCGVMPFYLGGRRVWNLGFRLAAAVQGRGYGTEAAVATADDLRARHPDDAIIGRVLEHNPASIRVLESAGLSEVRRGPASPDHIAPGGVTATRLVYADRELPVDLADTLLVLG